MRNYTDELLEKIRPAAQGYLEGLSYELVDLSLSKAKGRIILRLLADKPRGGISFKECADLNQGLSAILDRENTLEKSYVLEVSSPGVDRPLVSRKDFLRAQGRQIRVGFSEPFEGKRELTGIISKVEDDFLFLDSGEKTIHGERPSTSLRTALSERSESNGRSRTIKIPLHKIKKAKQVIK